MKLTFRATLTSILVSLLLLAMGSFGISFYRNAIYTAGDLSSQILDQTSQMVDFQVNDLLNVANEHVRTNRRLFDSRRFRVEEFPDMARYWVDLMEEHPRLTRLSIALESTGDWYHVARERTGLVVSELRRNPSTGKLELSEYRPLDYPTKPRFFDPDKEILDARQRPWYVDAKASGHRVWSETYMLFGSHGEPDVPGITCAMPILAPDQSLVGVLGASFDVIKLSTYLRSLRVGSTGYAFVVEARKDGTRQVIAHKDPKILVRAVQGRRPAQDSKDQKTTQELVPTDELSDRRVPAFLTQIPADLDVSKLRGTHQVEFDCDGVHYLGAYSCLSSRETPNWLICIVMPENDVLARVKQSNRETVAIGIVILVVTIVVGLWISRQVALPLEKIARETEAIGRMQWSRQPVANSMVLEVDRLARAIERTKTSLRSFRKYVPTDLIRLVHETGLEADLGGERRRLTVSFCDLANFTTLSETITPEDLVLHLGDYFGPLSRDIAETGGTVDKYIGDAIMAFWGAPEATDGHAISACDAALRNQASLVQLRRLWRAEGKPELFARVGIQTGDVIVGNIGSEARLNYTVVGDTVNLASRLEALAKQYGTEILIGESTYLEAGPAVVARAVDRVTVKGKTSGMMVYELLAMKTSSKPEFEELAALADRALGSYFARQWQAALDLFEQIDRIRPGDVPASVLAGRCRTFLETPPADDWDGSFRMATK